MTPPVILAAGKGRVLFSPKDVLPNPSILEYVSEAFDRLPSQTLPRKAERPVRRLTALAQALSRNGLRDPALHEVYQRLFARLDGLVESALRTDAGTVVW
jgi:hypothetical protein